jgi:hypothetical protein
MAGDAAGAEMYLRTPLVTGKTGLVLPDRATRPTYKRSATGGRRPKILFGFRQIVAYRFSEVVMARADAREPPLSERPHADIVNRGYLSVAPVALSDGHVMRFSLTPAYLCSDTHTISILSYICVPSNHEFSVGRK